MSKRPGVRRADWDTLPAFQGGDSSARQASNCEAAAVRARAFAESSRKSASMMHRSMTYWANTGGRPDIAAVYEEQFRNYTGIAELQDQMAVNADLLAAMFREEGGND